MRDALKRLERLEQMRATPRITSVVRFIVPAKEGGPAPWNPTWARARGQGNPITRQDGESAEAFEARARASFDAFTILIGCDPLPEGVLRGTA